MSIFGGRIWWLFSSETLVVQIRGSYLVALKLGDKVSRFGGRIWGSYLVARNLGDTRCPDSGVVFGGS